MMVTTFSMSGKGVMDPEKPVAQARKKVRLTLIGAMPHLKASYMGNYPSTETITFFSMSKTGFWINSCMKIKTNRECFD
jgi:hypothetical protein